MKVIITGEGSIVGLPPLLEILITGSSQENFGVPKGLNTACINTEIYKKELKGRIIDMNDSESSIRTKPSELQLERDGVNVKNTNNSLEPLLKDWCLFYLQSHAFEYERVSTTHFYAMKKLFQQYTFDAAMKPNPLKLSVQKSCLSPTDRVFVRLMKLYLIPLLLIIFDNAFILFILDRNFQPKCGGNNERESNSFGRGFVKRRCRSSSSACQFQLDDCIRGYWCGRGYINSFRSHIYNL